MDFTKCHNCGETGHYARECPALVPESTRTERPPWCGNCDTVTRLIDHGDYAARCPECHPLAWQMLPQHRTCGGCNTRVYAWDQLPCGSHQALTGPPKERVRH